MKNGDIWLVFFGGDAPDGWALQRLSQDVPRAGGVICADGGAAHALALGILPGITSGEDPMPKENKNPDLISNLKSQISNLRLQSSPLVVGDGDSLDPKLAKQLQQLGVHFRYYDPKKDFSDGEAALDAAIEMGAKEVYVYGALGGRIDHALANIFLLRRFSPLLDRLMIVGADCELFLCRSHEKIKGQAGDIISLLPISQTVKKIYLEGFSYPLKNEDLTTGSSRGLSNILKGEQGSINKKSGELLIIHYKQ
ncbi:MAG: thiamine diphosphokinase [Clostridiales bacterium]|jgi:thiamine pyrophosphokinase|nr:thiamine diphosphokinase [Clostridiales bacterium]MDR2712924.1 thiamine diphosphokinase [Clostridiales bacterium]